MKRLIIFFTVCVLILTPALSVHAKAKRENKTEEAVKKLELRWAEAYVKGDAAALDEIEAPEFILTDARGSVNTKADELREIKSGALKLTECKLSDLKIRFYGKTAVVTGLSTIKGTGNGKDLSGQYRFTDVLIRKKNVWKVVSSQETLLADTK